MRRYHRGCAGLLVSRALDTRLTVELPLKILAPTSLTTVLHGALNVARRTALCVMSNASSVSYFELRDALDAPSKYMPLLAYFARRML